jgi:hypothetical protein
MSNKLVWADEEVIRLSDPNQFRNPVGCGSTSLRNVGTLTTVRSRNPEGENHLINNRRFDLQTYDSACVSETPCKLLRVARSVTRTPL